MRDVSITVRMDENKRMLFNEYAKKVGISPGCLIRNFVYTTAEQFQAQKEA